MSNYRDETDPAEGFAWATELEVINGALDRHQSALETCYEVAAATAQAVVTHQLGAASSNRAHPRRF